MTRFWDGRTDGQMNGVTALLDLLSPSATQVKKIYTHTAKIVVRLKKKIKSII